MICLQLILLLTLSELTFTYWQVYGYSLAKTGVSNSQCQLKVHYLYNSAHDTSGFVYILTQYHLASVPGSEIITTS